MYPVTKAIHMTLKFHNGISQELITPLQDTNPRIELFRAFPLEFVNCGSRQWVKRGYVPVGPLKFCEDWQQLAAYELEFD
jgi:hypothetical protein